VARISHMESLPIRSLKASIRRDILRRMGMEIPLC
jgi:hypothetical protein